MKKVNLEYVDNLLKITFDFHPRKIEIIKSTLNGAYFDKSASAWFASKDQTRKLCRAFRVQEVYMNLSKEIQDEFNVNSMGYSKKEIEKKREVLRGHPSNASDKEDFNVDLLSFNEGMNPYPFQKAGISYGIELNGRVLIADEMGLGKTIQGIGIASYYKKDWPLLIIAPSSLLYNWKKELLLFLDFISEDDIKIMDGSKDKLNSLITICSYDYAQKREKELIDYLGVAGVLIVDESHNIKNNDSLRTKAIKNIGSLSKRALLISGTPFLNTPKELYSQLYILDPYNWKDYYDFLNKYCDAFKTKIKNRTILDSNGASNLDELNKLLIDKYMFRRKKAQVLKQLPPKKRFTRFLSSDVEQSETSFINELKEMCLEALRVSNGSVPDAKKYIIQNNSNYKGSVFEAYNETSELKSDKIANMVSDYFDEQEDDAEPLIVFAYHKEMMSKIEEKIKKNHPNIDYIKIDGSTPKEERFKMTESFQNNDSFKLAILSIEAASVGLTLTKSSLVWMAELPWTSGLALQAEDRAHRISQTKDVYIYYLIMENTIDSLIWKYIVQKSEVSNKVLDGDTSEAISESENEMEGADDMLTAFLIQLSSDLESV